MNTRISIATRRTLMIIGAIVFVIVSFFASASYYLSSSVKSDLSYLSWSWLSSGRVLFYTLTILDIIILLLLPLGVRLYDARTGYRRGGPFALEDIPVFAFLGRLFTNVRGCRLLATLVVIVVALIVVLVRFLAQKADVLLFSGLLFLSAIISLIIVAIFKRSDRAF